MERGHGGGQRFAVKKKEGARLSIDELLGIGVGRIGLSVSDFDRLTPEEFDAVAGAWQQSLERSEHMAWEVARTHAAIAIQPHVRKRITPRQLLPLPWDDKKPESKEQMPGLSRDEHRRRFEELMGRSDEG